MSSVVSIQDIFKDTYKYQSADIQIKNESTMGYTVNEIKLEDDGIYLCFDGMEYPERGVVSTVDMWHCNIAKRLMVESFRLTPRFWATWVMFIFYPWKYKIKFLNALLHSYNDVAFKAMSASIVKDEILTPMAKEMRKAIITFGNTLRLDENEVKQFAEILTNLINYDNAYRYRIQDLCNEVDVIALGIRPKTEIDRLLLINGMRDSDSVSKKFRMFGNIFITLLFIPKIQRAFSEVVKTIDISKMRPDKYDHFWMCMRGGYKFFGKTDAERRALINNLKVAKPTKIKV
jgi:hypothetical protein